MVRCGVARTRSVDLELMPVGIIKRVLLDSIGLKVAYSLILEVSELDALATRLIQIRPKVYRYFMNRPAQRRYY